MAHFQKILEPALEHAPPEKQRETIIMFQICLINETVNDLCFGLRSNVFFAACQRVIFFQVVYCRSRCEVIFVFRFHKFESHGAIRLRADVRQNG